MKNFLHFVLFRKMEWTDQHDVLFCRKVIAFELFTHKPGSKERRQCYDRIAESLNAVKDVYFKVDQRALRSRIKKLLKLYVSKKNREEKASGVEVGHSELDDLMLDIYDQHKQIENETSEASEKLKLAKDQDKLAAEEICACAVEGLSETRKRDLDKVDHGNQSIKISSNNKRRSSGGDTIAYLREKTERDCFTSRGDKYLKAGVRYCKINRRGPTETNSIIDSKLTTAD